MKKKLLKMLADFKAAGGTFGDCKEYFGVSSETDPYAAKAKELYADDDLEIDDVTVLAEGDDAGKWVLAWVWVTDEEAGVVTDKNLFSVSYTDAGFVRARKEVCMAISKVHLCKLNTQLQAEGAFPPGVLGVLDARISEDAEQTDRSDVKVFVTVELLLEHEDEDEVDDLEPPEALLDRVCDALVNKRSIEFEGSWEHLDTEPDPDCNLKVLPKALQADPRLAA